MLDKKFIINFQGNEFVLFEGLLSLFHSNGGKSIETEESQNSTATCPMFKATVKGEKGTYTGHGDADNTNVNSMIAKHKYRMAETRAIARALRWYNNIGLCSKDELGGDDTVVQKTPKTPPTAVSGQNPVVGDTINKLNNYTANSDNDDKEWVTDELFKDAIKKSVDAGTIKLGAEPKDVMKILRMKYKVAKKYEAMVEDEINSCVIK